MNIYCIIKFVVLWTKNKKFRRIFNSGLIDPKYYKLLNPEIDQLLTDNSLVNRYLATKHWIEIGCKNSRSPTHWFQINWYRTEYSLAKDIDPFYHFIDKGWLENKNPNQVFFTKYFKRSSKKRGYFWGIKRSRKINKSVWIKSWLGGAKPNPLFDTLFYIENNQGAIEKWGDPLTHYLQEGFAKKFDADGLFDIEYYRDANPSAAKLKIPELYHYIVYGANENTSPNRLFDPRYYKKKYKLDKLNGWKLFVHFRNIGIDSGFRPSKYFDQIYYATKYPEYAITHKLAVTHYCEVGVYRGYIPCKEVCSLSINPKYSILMPVYNTPKGILKNAINSVLFQVYPNWELCIVDDGSTVLEDQGFLEKCVEKNNRIILKKLIGNRGISHATAKALEMAEGDFISFLDHDDELFIHTLYEITRYVAKHNQVDLVYSDEDLIDKEGKHLESRFKPDYNAELLLTHNYINHFLVVKRSLVRCIEGFKEKYNGAQDYDLILRLTELSKKIGHVAESLYKWRLIESSTSINSNTKSYAKCAGLKAVRSAMARRNIEASVKSGDNNFFYEPRRNFVKNAKVAQIYIARSLSEEYLENLLLVLQSPITCSGPVFIVGDSHKISNIKDRVPKGCFVVYEESGNNNNTIAVVNDIASTYENIEYLAISGDGNIPSNAEWIGGLVAYGQYKDIGIVGGSTPSLRKLTELRKEELLRLNEIDSARGYKDYLVNGSRIFNNAHLPQDVLIISVEQMLIRRKLFLEMGGFCVDQFPSLFYDVDLSLRVVNAGYRNIFTPYCTSKVGRIGFIEEEVGLDIEKNRFKSKWSESLLVGDPYLNERFITSGGYTSSDDWRNWRSM